MSDPEKKEGNGDGGEKTDDSEALKTELGKRDEQIENLTKGIAKYRDDAQKSDKKVEELNASIEELKKQISQSTGEDVELDPDDEAKLRAWAQKHGYMTKEDIDKMTQESAQVQQQNMQAQAVNEFLENNKEFDDDEMWEKFKTEFSLYRTPTTLDGYRKLMDRVKKSITGGEDIENARQRGQAEAKTKGRLSLGGGSQGKGGNDASEMEKLREKYPSLTDEQIKARMSEIEELYPEDKK